MKDATPSYSFPINQGYFWLKRAIRGKREAGVATDAAERLASDALSEIKSDVSEELSTEWGLFLQRHVLC